GARAAAERRRDHVHFVAAGKDRDDRRIGQDERHLLLDEIPGDEVVVLLAEVLEASTNHGGGNTHVPQRDGEALRLQLAGGDIHVAGAVRTGLERLEGHVARHAAAVARRVAGADGGVTNLRTRCGRGTWLRRALAQLAAAGQGGGEQQDKNLNADPRIWRMTGHG